MPNPARCENCKAGENLGMIPGLDVLLCQLCGAEAEHVLGGLSHALQGAQEPPPGSILQAVQSIRQGMDYLIDAGILSTHSRAVVSALTESVMQAEAA